MPDLRALLDPRRLLVAAVVALVSAGPIACAQFGEPSTRQDCRKSEGTPVCP